MSSSSAPPSSARCSRCCSSTRARRCRPSGSSTRSGASARPRRAVKALQVYVSQLRKVLGDGVVETRPLGYVVRVDDGALDLQRFERLLAEGRALLAEERQPDAAARAAGGARALARSRRWRTSATRRSRQTRPAGWRSCGWSRSSCGSRPTSRSGRHAEAVAELEALVREHPLRENLRAPADARALPLRAAGRRARGDAATRARRSVDELGLDPSQALQRLEKAILRQDPALTRAPGRETVTGRPTPARTLSRPACDARRLAELPGAAATEGRDRALLRT